jgi:hypothetical protein
MLLLLLLLPRIVCWVSLVGAALVGAAGCCRCCCGWYMALKARRAAAKLVSSTETGSPGVPSRSSGSNT